MTKPTGSTLVVAAATTATDAAGTRVPLLLLLLPLPLLVVARMVQSDAVAITGYPYLCCSMSSPSYSSTFTSPLCLKMPMMPHMRVGSL
jgi:hypothetical protein